MHRGSRATGSTLVVNPEPEDQEDDGVHDRGSIAVAVRWNFIGAVGSQVARLLTSFVLARILGPESYGVVALAYVFLSLMSLFIDQTFGLSIIQKKSLSRTDLGTATTVNAACVLVLVALTLVAAPWTSSFFDEPRLTTVLRVLAITLAFRGLSAIPQSVLSRRLDFRAVAMVQLVGTFVSAVAALVAALAGAGVWALVVQALVGDGLVLLGATVLTGAPVFSFERGRVRSLLSFSGVMIVAQILNFVGLNADNTLIGRWRGPVELAYYSLGYRLMLLGLDLVSGVMHRVLLPVLARSQDEPARIGRGLLAALRAATIASFALLTLAILLAPGTVPAVLGDEWRPAIVPLQLLLGAAFARLLLVLWFPVMTALDRKDLILFWAATSVGLNTIGFFVGIHWGVQGVAASYVITNVLLIVPHIRSCGRMVGITTRRFLGDIAPAIAASLVLAVTWQVTRLAAGQLGAPELAAQALATVVGVAAYVLTLRAGWREVYDETLRFARLLGGRAVAAD